MHARVIERRSKRGDGKWEKKRAKKHYARLDIVGGSRWPEAMCEKKKLPSGCYNIINVIIVVVTDIVDNIARFRGRGQSRKNSPDRNSINRRARFNPTGVVFEKKNKIAFPFHEVKTSRNPMENGIIRTHYPHKYTHFAYSGARLCKTILLKSIRSSRSACRTPFSETDFNTVRILFKSIRKLILSLSDSDWKTPSHFGRRK